MLHSMNLTHSLTLDFFTVVQVTSAARPGLYVKSHTHTQCVKAFVAHDLLKDLLTRPNALNFIQLLSVLINSTQFFASPINFIHLC
jgi:uncharacterized membrane protein